MINCQLRREIVIKELPKKEQRPKQEKKELKRTKKQQEQLSKK